MQMKRKLWQAFSPILTGWLVVLLVLPALLGSSGAVSAAPLDNAFMELCADAAKGQQPHKSHDQDCPCCLPTVVQAKAVLSGAGAQLPHTVRRFFAFAFVAAPRQSVTQHIATTPPARGPPLVLSI